MSRKLKKGYEERENIIIEKILNMKLRELDEIPNEKKEKILEVIKLERKEISQLFPSERRVFQRCIVQEAEDKWMDVISQVKLNAELMKTKREEKDAAEQELKKAREKYEKAAQALRAEENTHERLQKKLKKAKTEYSNKKELLDKMLEIIIVHSSASIKQVYEYARAEILVMQTEEEILEGLLPDKIIDCNFGDNFIEIFPKGFKERHDEKTIKKIVDFCNSVIILNLALEDFDSDLKNEGITKIIPLYGDSEIAEILRLNGYDF